MNRSARVLKLPYGRHERRIKLKLAIHIDTSLCKARTRKLNSLLHLLDNRARSGPLRGIRKECYSRYTSRKIAIRLCRSKRNINKLLGRRIGNDGAVAKGKNRIAGWSRLCQIHNEARACRMNTRLRTKRMECRAKHIARRGNRACHKTVGATELHHHTAKVDALRAKHLGSALSI